MANNQNFIVKHGLTVGGNQYVIDSSGNWLGPDTPYANASFAVANVKAHIWSQDTKPTTANVNDVWIDSANGIQYTLIQDTDSSQWVEFGPIGSPTGNITFSDQTITGSVTNRDVEIFQQGTGNIWLHSSNTVVGNLIPFTVYSSIGSIQYPFNDIFLNHGSIYMTGNGAGSPVIIDNDANNVVVRSGGIKIFDGDLQANAGFRTAHLYNANVQGRLTVSNSTFNSIQSAFSVVGSSDGSQVTPANPGYMIHVTGLDGVSSRIVNDSFGTGAYGVFANRSARGTAASPSALLAGDVVSRWSGSPYGTTGFPSLGSGRIDIVAAQDQTDSNHGTRIEFWTTPNNTTTLTNIATFNGESVHFTGAITVGGGFIYTPKQDNSNNTTQTINFSTDAFIRTNISADTTFVPGTFVAGKVVDVFVTNMSGATRNITHGCYDINSTVGSTNKQLNAGKTMYMKYISYDGDLANCFVAITVG